MSEFIKFNQTLVLRDHIMGITISGSGIRILIKGSKEWEVVDQMAFKDAVKLMKVSTLTNDDFIKDFDKTREAMIEQPAIPEILKTPKEPKIGDIHTEWSTKSTSPLKEEDLLIRKPRKPKKRTLKHKPDTSIVNQDEKDALEEQE